MGSGNTELNMGTNPSCLSSATGGSSKLFCYCTGISDGKIHWTDFEEILNVFYKRSLSVFSQFHGEGLLHVIFNQLKKEFKRRILYIKEKSLRQSTVSFFVFSFLWVMLEVPILLLVAMNVSLRAARWLGALEQTWSHLKPYEITSDYSGKRTGPVINTWLWFCKGICLA